MLMQINRQLMLEHSLTNEQIDNILISDKLIYFKEYNNGFLSFIEDKEYDILFSAAIDNNYCYSMWKDLIKFIDNRERPIVVCFDKNQDRLYKAATRYDYKIISKNVIKIK